MLKSIDEISPLSVPRKTVLSAAEGFLRRLSGDNALVPVENIESPEVGGCDLAFFKRDSSELTIVKLHHQENFSDFFLRTVAYQRWLVECLGLSETILRQRIGLEVYLFSHSMPQPGGYLWKAISEISGLFLIEYRFLGIEGLQTPVIRFEVLHPKSYQKTHINGNPKDIEAPVPAEETWEPPTDSNLSPVEIDEFKRLATHHL